MGACIRKNISIYIHFPFCKSKCYYCDFYSVTKIYDDYVDYIIKEINLYETILYYSNIQTIYIGGGTPSLMGNDLVKVFNKLYSFDIKVCKEITMEVNPESFSKEKALLYRELGINRISIGIQSFDDRVLKRIGRLSDSRTNISAFETAKKIFDNISIDIIYGIPGQNIYQELKFIKDFLPSHVSFYCLTISKGTKLYKYKDEFKLSDKELNDQFIAIHDFLQSIGYEHYEVSNYAFDNKKSLHNVNYWNRGYYIGLGAGASGFILENEKEYRYTNHKINMYKIKLKKNKIPLRYRECIDDEKRKIEVIMLSLRKSEGLSLKDFCDNKKLMDFIEYHANLGYWTLKDGTLVMTAKGWCVLDNLVSQIVGFI